MPTELIRPVMMGNPNKIIGGIFSKLQRKKKPSSCCFGRIRSTAGLATREDIIEEIVYEIIGDINDEYDHEVEE
ncbi:MAG: HlyC/CorC family transporter, partial [Deltaproteobacteria bacterium]|nr:HlyC/CorC family transporter [Deltaproteobacteria bacterium]